MIDGAGGIMPVQRRQKKAGLRTVGGFSGAPGVILASGGGLERRAQGGVLTGVFGQRHGRVEGRQRQRQIVFGTRRHRTGEVQRLVHPSRGGQGSDALHREGAGSVGVAVEGAGGQPVQLQPRQGDGIVHGAQSQGGGTAAPSDQEAGDQVHQPDV